MKFDDELCWTWTEVDVLCVTIYCRSRIRKFLE